MQQVIIKGARDFASHIMKEKNSKKADTKSLSMQNTMKMGV